MKLAITSLIGSMISLHLPKGFNQIFIASISSLLIIFLVFQVFSRGQKNISDWYQLIFAFASLILYLKLFIYTFTGLLKLIQNKKSAILIISNLILSVLSSYFAFLAVTSLAISTYPDITLFGITAASVCFLAQVLLNQDQPRASLIIIATSLYAVIWLVLQFQVGSQYFITNPRVSILFYQIISGLVLGFELCQLLLVTRYLGKELPDENNISKAVS